ncbi:MAG: 30S ribosomal protein S15, partial [Nanoarchaeota archaeon]
IGLQLRDTYGIPSVKQMNGKSIEQIMKSHKLPPELPSHLLNLIINAVKIKKHLEKNKHDKVAKRGLQLTEAKINRLARYYKQKGVLRPKWKYEEIKL